MQITIDRNITICLLSVDIWQVTFNDETVSTTSEMLVNGETYGEDDEDDKSKEKDELETWAIVLIAIACITLFLAVVAYLVYRVYSKKRKCFV